MSSHLLGRAVKLLVDAQPGALGSVIDFLQKAAQDPKWIVAFQLFLEKKNVWPTDEKPLAAPAPKLWAQVSGTQIRVNLDFALRLPFDGATPKVWHAQTETSSLLERRGDELYRNGKKITFFLTKGQQKGTVKGHQVRKVVKAQAALHPNELDALIEAWEMGLKLIPESWKANEQGQTLYIFFWGAGFRDSDGNLYARYLCWGGGQWVRSCLWLDGDWGVQAPAAVPAS